MKHLVNFADSGFEAAQRLNSATALRKGGFDAVHSFSPEDIEPAFLDAHGEILRQRRGSGYWLWKPHFIQRVLDSARDGDFVFYSDAGAMFIRKVDHLIAAMDRAEVDVMSFELPLPELQWTNSRTFQVMGCESDAYRWTNQRNGAFMLFRKTPYATSFVEEFLSWCTDASIVTDASNEIARDPFSITHRHDQSIFSLLCKRRGLPAFRDCSDYGIRPRQYLTPRRFYYENRYDNSPYPVITLHFRRANPRLYRIKAAAKDLLGRVVRL
jgi:hypothetical protein